MAEREIVSLTWHRRNLQIEMSYLDGDPEHWIGSDVVAAVLAADAGLSLMPASDEAVRWSRDPGSSMTRELPARKRHPSFPGVASVRE